MNLPEIAIILLPLASLSGYLLGRRGGEKTSGERVNLLSKQYFQGLNHLLNEEQDQAMALFERIADDDTDRFETQLALGNLFRRRGELDRAIRLHQDLSIKAMLSTEQRAIALLELGEDFIRAGLLDRAEALFDELLEIDAQSAPALEHLIGIYQQEREWLKAINAAERLQQLSAKPMGRLIAHFYCERVLALRAKAQPQTATTEAAEVDASAHELEKAFKADPHSVRVALMQAQLAIEQKNLVHAEIALRRAVELDVNFVNEAVPLTLALMELNAERATAILRDFAAVEKGAHAILALSDALEAEPASDLLRARLAVKPSPRVLLAWMRRNASQNVSAIGAPGCDELEFIFAALKQTEAQKLTHRCSQCGFGTVQQHWQCPSCKTWGNTKPLVMP